MQHGRLRWLTPDDLDERARAVYDEIAGGPRAQGSQAFALTDDQGRLNGPFNAMLVSPEVGDPVQALGSAIRYRTSLDSRSREIAILALAVTRQCDFEWYAHVRVGAAAGLTAVEIEALHSGQAAPSFSGVERTVHQVVCEVATSRHLSDRSYEVAQSVLGQVALNELIVLVGYYDLLELLLSVWRTPLPAGEPSPFAERSASTAAE